MEAISQYPVWFLVGIGLVVITNLGLIWAVGVAIFKFGMFVQETKAGIAAAADSAKMAHKRLNGMEGTRR